MWCNNCMSDQCPCVEEPAWTDEELKAKADYEIEAVEVEKINK